MALRYIHSLHVKCHFGFASEEARRTLTLAGGRKEESRRANRENRGEFYERRHFSRGKKRNSLPFTLPSRLDAAQKADCQRRKENVGDASEMLLFSRRKREISAASGIAAMQVLNKLNASVLRISFDKFVCSFVALRK